MDIKGVVKAKLTLSAGTEGAGGNLVAELATFLAAELLALLTSEKSLVLVHILLVLLASRQIHERSGAVALLSGLSTHGVEELGDLLLNDGVGRLLAFGALLLTHLLALLLLLNNLLLLPLLGLGLGKRSLRVHARPEAANVALLGGDHGRLLSADGSGVDGSVGEEVLRVRRGVKLHIHIQASRILGRRCVEVEHVVLRAQTIAQVVHSVTTVVAANVRVGLIHGQGAGEGTRNDASLLLVEIILMARASERL